MDRQDEWLLTNNPNYLFGSALKIPIIAQPGQTHHPLMNQTLLRFYLFPQDFWKPIKTTTHIS